MASKQQGRPSGGQFTVEPTKGRGAKLAMLIAGCFVALLAVVYCAGCIFFYQRFWPNTIIGDANVSLMGASSARAALEQSSQERTVNVSGQGISFSLNGASAGLELNVDTAVTTALAKNASWQWPLEIFKSHDDSDVLSASFDTDLLHSAIEGQLGAYNSIATDPSDAFLFFDESTGSYQINPGSMGTKLDVDSVMNTIMESLGGKKQFAPLTSNNLVQQNVKADDERLINAMNAANAYLGCNLDDSDVLSASFDTDLLHSAIEGQLGAYNSIATDPSDAFLFFDESTGSYQINPGSMGTKLDVDSVMNTIMESLGGKKQFAPLTSNNLVQQNVKADDERLINAMNAANAYLGCNLELTVASTPVAWVNPATVKDWIVIDGDYNVWLDESKLDAWVDALEAQVDTGEQAGYVRTYTRPNDGKYITVTGGSYGWISNGEELAQLVRDTVANKTVGSQEIPWKQTADRYNPGGADWGNRYVDVDLTEQWAYFFDEWGTLVKATPIISGSSAFGTSRLTPEGSYYITNKQRDQVLKGLPDPNNDNKPLYETLVYYWMPFIGNMVGLHDAYWQPVWEDWVYTTADGSHGCVNLPPDVAAWCWDWITIGTPVITHY